MQKRIKEIKSHLERADARFERFSKIEVVREKKNRQNRIIKAAVGLLIFVCTIYAIFAR